MSTPNNTDLLLVERGGSQYKVPYSDLNNKLDTDVFLVERGGVQYKVLGEFIGGSEVGVVTAAPVLTATNDSKAPAVITVENATVENATLTSGVWLKDGVAIAAATGSSFSATDHGVYTIKQTWTDALGNTFQVEAQLELLNPARYVDEVFSTFLYDGTGDGSAQTITNGIDLSGEGGLVWSKKRNASAFHVLSDTERGVHKYLKSNESSAEQTNSGYITQFNSNGYAIGGGGNINYDDMVSWTFRKAPGFFDVVTYTGTGSAQNISHSLGSVPGMIIVKKLGDTQNWGVYHRSAGATKFLLLNETSSETSYTDAWNDTAPTATQFTVGSVFSETSGGTYVAYLFAHDDQSFGTDGDEAIIKCGSYTGNGSTPGVTVDLGFEPQFVLIKNSDYTNATSNWMIFDMMRGLTAQPISGTQGLAANLSTPEGGTYIGLGNTWLHPTSTGFIVGNSANATNRNGDEMVYMAIRRPNQPPTAGTEVFQSGLETPPAGGNIYGKTFTSGFPVDLTITSSTAASSKYWLDRVRGTRSRLESNDSGAAFTGQNNGDFDRMDGWNEYIGVGQDIISWMFKRAPGFFDVVTYTGTGGARTVNHNLAAIPELIIIKRTDTSKDWPVYDAINGPTKYLKLNSTDASLTGNFIVNNTAPTSTQITVGDGQQSNGNNGTFIAYLFATLAGVSKVGSYSGTGSDIDVDCGFTTGARFVMIKRTDSTGDWFVWDTARGINGANEPYLRLNSTNIEVTGTDYIDPLISGFKVTSSAPAEINFSGGEYLFLAIA